MRKVLTARRAAQTVLREHPSIGPRVDVKKIARAHAQLIESNIDDDISGALVPVGESWVILVNKAHPETRRRFTIAHELGHLLLHGYKTPHADMRFRFRDARSSDGSAIEEIQANAFAAELLMPEKPVRELASKQMGRFSVDDADEKQFAALVGDLAKAFGVSKHAMRIRLTSLFA